MIKITGLSVKNGSLGESAPLNRESNEKSTLGVDHDGVLGVGIGD